MEYVITASRPFGEIEAKTIGALEQRGFVVRRTFSLHSATGGDDSSPGRRPGYSVLMLYAAGAQRQPLGLVMLYQQGKQTVINPVLTAPSASQAEPAPGSEDADAELIAALVLAGLDLCLDHTDGTECITLEQALGDSIARQTQPGHPVRDPVCGKWIQRHRAQAAIEYGGRLYHVCCSVCRREFERDPGRYAYPESPEAMR